MKTTSLQVGNLINSGVDGSHTTTALISNSSTHGNNTGSDSNISAKDVNVDKSVRTDKHNEFIVARASGSKKWKFMRQKSQQMLAVLSPSTINPATTGTSGLGSESPGPSELSPGPTPTSPLAMFQGSAPPTPLAPPGSTAPLLREFNEALNEYRSEIRDNIAQLDAKINRLEVVMNELSEQLPDIIMARGRPRPQSKEKTSTNTKYLRKKS